MTNRKIIAAVVSIAMGVALLCTGCEMSVNAPIPMGAPIFEPYISVQPASYSYAIDKYSSAPTLSIEVWDWNDQDGTLTFQWYQFDRLEQYYKSADDPIEPIEGARGKEYQPEITAPRAGDRYYYYVEVTNTNGMATGGKTSATVQSDVAIIAFGAAGSLDIPVIKQNPASNDYTMGRSIFAPLDVWATVGGDSSVQYQWYKFKLADGFNTNGTPNGTPVSGATQRTYLPEAEDLGVGPNYYYVVVSNVTTNPEGMVTARADQYSIPAIIRMGLGEKAAPPRINQQPRDITYIIGNNASAADTPKLMIGAVPIDGGALTYRWYSSDTAVGAGTAVPTSTPGATAEVFPPDINTSAAGEKYYYVVITNTNGYVTGQTVETITSKRAKVKVQAPGTIPASAAVITVDPATRYQYIRGYGGMETTWGNFFQSDPADMKKMFDPEILGFNIWRIMIPPITTNIDDPETGLEQYVMNRTYTNRYYENVKIVNSYNGYVLASPWSPPKEWKSNNSINSGGNLMPQYYRQYANYLRSYARHMAGKGAPIYAISIANEPNYAGGYDGCEWSNEEMRDFFKEVGRFTQGVRGWGGGKAIPTVLTVNGESANTPNINLAAMNDPVSNAAIDLFARHVYGEQTVRLWGNPNLKGREVWMTEHNINSASSTAFPNDWTWNYVWRFMNDVDLVIRLNNENAFVWWVVKRFYSFIGDGEANSPGGEILPRGWGLAHYARFSIDNTRIEVNVSGSGLVMGSNVNSNAFNLDNPSIRVTAFISQDGNEISLVMFTPTSTDGSGGFTLGDAQIQMPTDFKIRSATAMRSQAGRGGGATGTIENMGQIEGVTIAADRQSAYINLPRSQILSVKFIKE